MGDVRSDSDLAPARRHAHRWTATATAGGMESTRASSFQGSRRSPAPFLLRDSRVVGQQQAVQAGAGQREQGQGHGRLAGLRRKGPGGKARWSGSRRGVTPGEVRSTQATLATRGHRMSGSGGSPRWYDQAPPAPSPGRRRFHPSNLAHQPRPSLRQSRARADAATTAAAAHEQRSRSLVGSWWGRPKMHVLATRQHATRACIFPMKQCSARGDRVSPAAPGRGQRCPRQVWPCRSPGRRRRW